MPSRLLAGALWPLVAIVSLCLAIATHALAMRAAACEALMKSLERHKNVTAQKPSRRSAARTALSRCLYATTMVCYLALPSVSRSIFLARQCASYTYDDASLQTVSFLVADPSLHCNSGPGWSNEARSLDAYFWSLFVFWNIFVPTGFLALLLPTWSALRAQRVGKMAQSSSFLWREYECAYLYWEVIDLWRKMFLTSMILFIDTSEGSSKLLRLTVAIVVSALYLSLLALVRPFRRVDDGALACAANLMLICAFASGMVLQLCEEGRWSETCHAFVGLSSSYSASAFVVVLSASMLALFCFFNLAHVVSALTMPTLRLASSGHAPVLDLRLEHHFHLFLSHVWGTGQDQAGGSDKRSRRASFLHPLPCLQVHTLVRQLQLVLPGVRIWLDVVNLEDISKLEEAVDDAAVIIVFLSKNYFASANCRS